MPRVIWSNTRPLVHLIGQTPEGDCFGTLLTLCDCEQTKANRGLLEMPKTAEATCERCRHDTLCNEPDYWSGPWLCVNKWQCAQNQDRRSVSFTPWRECASNVPMFSAKGGTTPTLCPRCRGLRYFSGSAGPSPCPGRSFYPMDDRSSDANCQATGVVGRS